MKFCNSTDLESRANRAAINPGCAYFRVKFGLALVAIALSSAMAADAVSVTFAWDPVPNVAGYKLYDGVVSHTYAQSFNAGTNTQYSVSNLVAGTTYYFAVTAYDATGLESAYSTEFAYTPQITIGTPTIAVTAPKDGSTINGQTVPFTVSANANGHTIKKVQYFRPSGLMGESTNSPYSLTCTNIGAGILPVVARMVYDSGTVADSAPITLFVVPPGSAQNNRKLQLSTYKGMAFVTGSGTSNRTYEVQCSTDLKNWTVKTTIVADLTGALSYLDNSPTNRNLFYRVRDTGH